MGLIISRFRKEKTTYQKLETLEEKIKNIEAYTVSTQHRQKRFVGNFLLISIGLYVLGFLVFYFVFLPPTWEKRLLYSIPLIISPFLIFVLKRLVGWYFQRKVNKNSKQLTTLRTEKKKIIENVMEKETYKVALEILNRFEDKSVLGRPLSQSAHTTPVKSVTASLALTPKTMPKATFTPQNSQSAVRAFNTHQHNQTLQQRITVNQAAIRAGPTNPALQPLPGTPLSVNSMQLQRYATTAASLNKRTPYPVINQHDKTVLEKMVDYLIGDGPNNRFAMICKECCGHNGMALQEEYEYAAFRCAFCNTLNPAKKQRPIAPRLPSVSMDTPGTPNRILEIRKSGDSSTSPSEKDSGSDSDDTTESQIDENRKAASESPEPTAPVQNGVEADMVEADTTATETVATPEKPAEEKKTD